MEVFPLEPGLGRRRSLTLDYGFTDVDGSRRQVWRFLADEAAAGRSAALDPAGCRQRSLGTITARPCRVPPTIDS
jgi:hypothetical protein